MSNVSRLKRLRKGDRAYILAKNPGFLTRIAERTGKKTATVSRVFNGGIKYSPDIQEAIEEELAALEATNNA